MNRRWPPAVAALVAAAVAAAVAGAAWGAPVPTTGCPLFPADDAWHADVAALPVHPRSADWLASMGGPTRRLHPDFGPAGDGEQPYGIPYAVVGADHPRTRVTFEYADESDDVEYPLGPDTPVERGSDRHALVVDRDACRLYELYAVDRSGGQPRAGSGAVWDLRSSALRPAGWTSADAAGLPILPGLLRLDEVRAGHVDHAVRMTASRTDRSYLWPARHQAGAAADPALPPMGARFRLRGDFDMSGFRPDTVVVLAAMKRHGMVLADNGSNWYFTGTSEPGWDIGLLDELKRIPAGAFEAVDVSSLMADPDSGRVAGIAVAQPAPPTTGTPPPTTTAAPPGNSSPPSAPPSATAPPTNATTGPPRAVTATTAAAPESPSTAAAAPPRPSALGTTTTTDTTTAGRFVGSSPVDRPDRNGPLVLVALAAAAASGAWLRRRRRSGV